MIRATEQEKQDQINTVEALSKRNADEATSELRKIQLAAIEGKNVFEELMEACKVCSLGQITDALFEVGGQYRRNM
ncbi:MAG: methylmalonyl-CoA mutase [Flavobacteriales bacterium]|nr:methylmalonyl-CoA mutase [Flavobacteriales bacterium]